MNTKQTSILNGKYGFSHSHSIKRKPAPPVTDSGKAPSVTLADCNGNPIQTDIAKLDLSLDARFALADKRTHEVLENANRGRKG